MKINVLNYRLLFAISIVIIMCWNRIIFAAFESRGYGSEFISCGRSGIASRCVSFASFINPAKLGFLRASNIEFYYKNYFSIRELNQVSIHINSNAFILPFGIGVSRFGTELYQESELSFAAAVNLYENVIIGVALQGNFLKIPQYGSTQVVGFHFGGTYRLLKSADAAFVIKNLNEPDFGRNKNRLPVEYAMGFSYTPLSELDLNFDWCKSAGFDFDCHLGITYTITKFFSCSFGFIQQVNMVTGGFKLMKLKVSFGYAFEYHSHLHFSHTMSLAYEI